METIAPSGIKLLNYGLATFAVAFPAMILLYQWLA